MYEITYDKQALEYFETQQLVVVLFDDNA